MIRLCVFRNVILQPSLCILLENRCSEKITNTVDVISAKLDKTGLIGFRLKGKSDLQIQMKNSQIPKPVNSSYIRENSRTSHVDNKKNRFAISDIVLFVPSDQKLSP